jgi:hypothetical protein
MFFGPHLRLMQTTLYRLGLLKIVTLKLDRTGDQLVVDVEGSFGLYDKPWHQSGH